VARPAKTLQERVRDRSFLARRHGGLLAGPLVGSERLREIQRRWQDESSEVVRRALEREYGKLVAADGTLEDAQRPAQRPSAAGEGFDLPVARFFPAMFSHVKGPAAGQPFTLERWQRRFVEEFSRVNGGGERVYKRGMLGVARGNGKSPLAAGLALRELVCAGDEPDVILAAAARDQARVVFEYARGLLASGPLAEALQVGRHEIRNPANGGVLRTVSADGFVAHGLNPSAVVIDELHAWNTNKQHELFDALDTAVHKRPGGFWLVITTAGHDKLSLLGRLYGNMLAALELEEGRPGLVVGRDEWNGVLMHWYGAAEDADVDDRKLWRAVNPASFVSTEALRKQRNSPSMSRSTFARLHLNAWVAPDVERWIATDGWERLAGTVEIADGATVFVGADGSRAYDTTAVAWAARAPDGRVDVDARIFSVRDDVPHHVFHADGTIDFADVEGFLLELASRFDVREVRFDPRFLERSMEVLAARLPGSAVAPVEPYSNVHRQALAALERAVFDGTLRHPSDPAVTGQVLAAACDRFDNGDVRRLRKLDRTRPIDAAVALALAVQGATIVEAASVYDSRGLITV
jgi:phage terminase large subunit-like protein